MKRVLTRSVDPATCRIEGAHSGWHPRITEIINMLWSQSPLLSTACHTRIAPAATGSKPVGQIV